MKMPKLAKDLAGLIGISRKETNLDTLAAALEEARAQVEAATTAREAADTAYRESILDASPAEMEKLQAAKGRAVVELDRAEALVAALTNRIASVRTDQERAARKAIHADAVSKCDAIRARLPEEYRHHALAIRGLLRDLAEAEVARKRAEPLSDEFGPIESVEYGPRGLAGIPEEIIEQTEVKLWAIDGRAEPLPAERQGKVHDRGDGRGQLLDQTGGGGFTCTRYRYKRTRYREAVGSPYDTGSLLNRVNLPAFGAYGDDFATAERFRSADTALDHLSRELTERPEHQRQVLERLEMVTEKREDGSRVATSLRSVA